MVLRVFGILASFLFLASAHASETAQLARHSTLPQCKDLDYTASLAIHPDAFGAISIELAIDDYRGWIKKKIRAFVSLAKRGHARKAKRTSGVMTFHTKAGVSCTAKVKFRAHGDLADHYPGDISEEPSLNVKLVDGHIFGITKFILFRPETRNGVDEVFAATLLGELGFLAPRSSMSTLQVVGSKKPAAQVIFQEKIVKEFLEVNGVREGPIIEGDERFFFSPKYEHLGYRAGLGRISNFKWARKGPSSMAIAAAALGQANKLFFRYDKGYASVHGGNMFDMVEIATRLDEGRNRLKFDTYPAFEATIYSLGGSHGFSQDDRRAIYDPLMNGFLPIYYDGGTSILTKPSAKFEKISMTAQKGVPAALARLAGLDVPALQALLKTRDVDLSAPRLRSVLTQMRNRLAHMATTDEVQPVVLKTRTIYRRANNGLSYVFAPDKTGRLEVCRDSLNRCDHMDATPKLLAKLMGQGWADEDGRPGIYFAFPKTELDSPFSGFIDRHDFEIRRQSMKVVGVQLDLFGDIDGRVDEESRTISLKRFGPSGRAVVSNGSLSGWAITLDDVSGHVKNTKAGEQNFDILGLTGCLTLTDVDVSGLDLSVRDATCEDGINLVRVTGSLRRLVVRNAAFDAVDADFSKLEFAEIIVDVAGNDCLDLSYGDYRAKNLILKHCGDKAVSIGETSKATIENVLAQDSSIGLAAKDFGSIKLTRGKILDSEKCYDLYNKKQEFSGGYLEFASGALDCGGATGTVGPTSQLRDSAHF